MEIPICCHWFNEVYYPEVYQKTCHPIILLLDNAPGHFKSFQRENVVLRHFIPNVTRWKQLYDLGVIAAVKKRYKFLIVKDVLSLYQLDSDNKQLLK